jgi:hypothetical protein
MTPHIIHISVEGMIDAVEYVKRIKVERDYYRQVVKRHLPLYYIDKDEQTNSRITQDGDSNERS